VNVSYAQLCPLIGIVVVFGCSAPASLALLLLIVQLKLKYDSYLCVMGRQRPCVKRAKDTGYIYIYIYIYLTTKARQALKREQEMKRDAETQTDN
jgi:hypothetical protein